MSDLMNKLDLTLIAIAAVKSLGSLHYPFCLLLKFICSHWYYSWYFDLGDILFQAFHWINTVTIVVVQSLHRVYTSPSFCISIALIIDPGEF
jgi:hypothetical protein